MTFDFDALALKAWLIEHNVRLRPPATPEALRELRSAFPGDVHSDVINLYAAFDGCDQSDFEIDSFFTIWPIAKGLAYARERGLERDFAFGDVDLAADVALCSLLEPSAPVRWHDGILLAQPSFAAFFGTLRGGKLWDR